MVRNQTRAEIRYYVDPRKAPGVRKTLSRLMNRNIFPKPYNRTLYFNNSLHEVPFTYSIRARRYESRPLRSKFRLDPDDKWIFEFKTTKSVNGRFIRYKRRAEELELAEILERVGKIRKLGSATIPHKLVPHSAASYVRSHFLESSRGIRVTVDEDLRFYEFTEDLSGKMLDKSDHAVVELKIPPHRTDSELANELQHILRKEDAYQGVSKKATTFNLIAERLTEVGKIYEAPRHDTEIEAKIALESEDQDVFHEIRHDLANGELDGFRLSEGHDQVVETGRLHQYVLTPQNDYVRIEPKTDAKFIAVRENLQIAQDPYNLGNVIKRHEQIRPTRLNLDKVPSRVLQRKRKYFMVERTGGRGEYAVVIDRTTHKGHELYQMEIDDVLNSPSFTTEARSINDVATIANYIVDEYSLTPTTLTKGEWLMSLPN
jgi:VTC domain